MLGGSVVCMHSADTKIQCKNELKNNSHVFFLNAFAIFTDSRRLGSLLRAENFRISTACCFKEIVSQMFHALFDTKSPSMLA